MEDLIKALTIFLKYGNPANPTHCEHDVLWIVGIDPTDVSREDTVELERLGFWLDDNDDSFKSFRFGSA